ncbi:helix-turn-helix domain-containing protein [Kibdelosporangium lantanae]|uniref:Helix-turn-helix domain-containing protein n=1 Tax=Kibdelosporangium lantanae TaxID=1497396 RepID=A0ABW3M0N4_9PSEU
MSTTNTAELAALLAQLAQALAQEKQEQRPEVPAQRSTPERVLLTVEEAAQRLGIGRTMMFKLVKAGEVASVTIGRLRRVPASAVRDYAAHLANQHQAA